MRGADLLNSLPVSGDPGGAFNSRFFTGSTYRCISQAGLELAVTLRKQARRRAKLARGL